ncbi:MAG: response regulator transcription factor [Chiayiivirga sp.]|uniref:response regulator transcription factor n=1 Tax=Chiayiivirga sp. TaxID=2041042 RepID=UPI0025C05389|nr:response regulator transcription factor [Chiayiivirga sp.]MCI1710007.1 response regulator transcription factor [Chiayiivirga sp.]MCI1730432.1 response regulator transcription factor [Chiayiivirga sp.]
MSIRVALIDDQDLVREGIKSLLALSGEVAVPVEGRHGDDLLQADLSAVDVVVMDIRMPGRDGLSALRELRRRGDPRPVLMLTTFEEPELFEQAVAAGAQGFLRKDASPESLIDAIRRVHAGGSALQPMATEGLRQGFAYRDLSPPDGSLTERELGVLRLMAGGYANKEIARMLFLAEGTVKNYVSDLLLKLNARDRTQAVLKAISLRLI